MMGNKTLAEIRAELEAALGRHLAEPKPPDGTKDSAGQVAVLESLRRFLNEASAKTSTGSAASNKARQPTGGPTSGTPAKSRRRGRSTK